MFKFRSYLFLLILASSLATSASAQVRFDVIPNPYMGPGLSVSVGNNGYCQQPAVNGGYAVYPMVRGGGYRNNGPVVVVPVNNGYYNQGYYPNGGGYYPAGNNGYYVNNGYYQAQNRGYYNPGYARPGYGQGYYNNNRRCR